MSLRTRTDLRHYAWLVVLCVLLAGCAPAPSPSAITPLPVAQAPPTPVHQPAAAPADSPATPGDECLGRGTFPPLLPGLRYGVNAFLFGADHARVLALASTVGFGWLRQQIHWRDIEIRPGIYDWGALDIAVAAARGQGAHVLLSVVRSPRWATASGAGGLPGDPAAIVPFAQALASRYAGQVSAYEIWNEPNLALENGGRAATPAQYLATLRAAYTAIKQADPCALVLAAPLAATATDDPAIAADDLRFYRELYALDGGAFLRAADALALHPGGGDQPFDARWPGVEPARSRFYFRHVEEVRALMEQAGDQRQAWITEVGWATRRTPGGPPAVSPQVQADNLVGALELTRASYPWVAAIFVWNLNFAVLGPPEDEKSAFGILKSDWSPQPAYLALQGYLGARAEAERRSMAKFSGGAPYRQIWQFPVNGKSRTTPVIDPEGSLYVGSDPGRLYAISPGGGLRWAFDAPGGIRTAPALAPDRTLYLWDESGQLTALRPDGSVLWRRALGGAIRGTPQVTDEALLVGTANGEAIRLDLTGDVVWRTPLGAPAAPPLLARAHSGEPAMLYVPTTAGDLLALTIDGTIRWRAAIGNWVISSPALATPQDNDLQLLVADAEGSVSSFDPASGRLRWRRQVVERSDAPKLPLTSALVAVPPLVGADGTIYIGSRAGILTALDPQGQPRWRYDSGDDISSYVAEDRDGTIYIGLFDERLLALDHAGRLRWQVDLNAAVRSAAVHGPDGRLYVSTLGGRVYALAPTSGG
jgi:polysaccharide biosynthesis protein PslG